MVFGMELGDERCRSENGEALTARRTNSLCDRFASQVAVRRRDELDVVVRMADPFNDQEVRLFEHHGF